jgi:adenine-specific DNA-methyltransferase
MAYNKNELVRKIQSLQELSNEEKSALLELLRTHKKYGLVWEDKPEEVEERLRSELPVLKEVKERAIISDDPDAPNHILIEGDNLEALVALTYTHAGKIDVIYIDPPYNTGNRDFIYNDAYVDREDGYRHSKWLSFMEKRLKIAKSLLSSEGTIFISIDDNEQAQLKLLCDEVFGLDNYVTSIPRITKLQRSAQEKHMDISHDYLICYSFSEDFAHNIARDIDESRVRKDDIGTYIEGDTKAILADKSKGYSAGGDYDFEYNGRVYSPVDRNGVRNRWLWTRERMEAAAKLGILVETGSSLRMQLYLDKRFDDKTNKMVPRSSNLIFHTSDLMSDSRFTNSTGSAELRNVEDSLFRKFNNPKPLSLIRTLLTFYDNKNIRVLDFFAGSGTTLHAIMLQNAEDGGLRTGILISNNENNICEEVTYIRNKKVIESQQNAPGLLPKSQNNLRYFKTDFVGRERTSKGMRDLMYASTELLCIKNELYSEVQTLSGKKLNAKIARFFDDGKKRMLVVYQEEAIPAIAELIASMDYPGKMLVYVFSPGNYPYEDEFVDVLDKVELCALPAAIYNAYRKVLPKKKVVKLPEAEDDDTPAAAAAPESDSIPSPEGQLNLKFG